MNDFPFDSVKNSSGPTLYFIQQDRSSENLTFHVVIDRELIRPMKDSHFVISTEGLNLIKN